MRMSSSRCSSFLAAQDYPFGTRSFRRQAIVRSTDSISRFSRARAWICWAEQVHCTCSAFFDYDLSLNSLSELVRPILSRSFSLIGQVSNHGAISSIDSYG